MTKCSNFNNKHLNFEMNFKLSSYNPPSFTGFRPSVNCYTRLTPIIYKNLNASQNHIPLYNFIFLITTAIVFFFLLRLLYIITYVCNKLANHYVSLANPAILLFSYDRSHIFSRKNLRIE